MKKVVLSAIAVTTILSTVILADGYTMTPDGNYVGGDSSSMTSNES